MADTVIGHYGVEVAVGTSLVRQQLAFPVLPLPWRERVGERGNSASPTWGPNQCGVEVALGIWLVWQRLAFSMLPLPQREGFGFSCNTGC